jgi:hypothetical protein
MRGTTIGFSAFTVLAIAAGSVAGRPQQEPPLQPPAGPQQNAEFPHTVLPEIAVPPLADFEIAGLPRIVRPEVLTWDRIYALAILRSRARRGAFAPALDLRALADESARHNVADFERFRIDFRVGGLFRDPGPAVLELDRRLMAIENARRGIAVLENLFAAIVARSQGSTSGLTRIDIDTIFVSLVGARDKLAGEIRQFRDGLDELKFLLGLSPRAPVVLERQNLKAFSDVFEQVESWARQTNRRLADLPQLMDRFPALGEVVLNGEPILERIEKHSDQWEEVLTAAAQVAFQSRSEREKAVTPPNSGVQLELRVRRRIRGLVDTRRAFEVEKRRYELAVRLRDQAYERLLAPATAVATARAPHVTLLVDQLARVLETQDRLVGLWTSFRAERLALYHDLGVLPYSNWQTFSTDLSAPSVVAAAVPAVQPKPGAGERPQPPQPPPSPAQ